MNDSELLSAYVKDGSEDAFTALVNRHMKLVFSAALRQVGGDAHLARDVVQQVFSALARKAGTLRHHPALSGWLYTTTHHAAAATIRAERRRQAVEHAALLLNETSLSEAPDVWARIRPVLDQAMNELGARDRQALLLRYFENRPFADVGEKLSLSENAARMRVARALDKMHALLARHGVASTTAALALILTEHAAAASVPVGLAAEISGTALAGAAGAGALASASFLTAIKTGAGMLGVLLIGLGIYEYRTAHTTETAAAAVRQDYNAGTARLETLESRIRSDERTRAALQIAIDRARTIASSGQNRNPELTSARDARADGQAFLAAFPEQRTALIAIGRAQISASFRPFYRAAGLSSDLIDQFENFVAEAWAQNLIVAPDGIYPDSTAIPQDQLRALLGDQSYQHYRTYQRGAGAYGLSLQVTTALTTSNLPSLSPDQADQLAEIILNQSPGYQNGGTFSPATVSWDAVLAQAQGMLTAAQLKVAEGLFLNLQYRLALQAERVATPAGMSPLDRKTSAP
jgi:RNA polymerase sigma factor (sigma-70 family)